MRRQGLLSKIVQSVRMQLCAVVTDARMNGDIADTSGRILLCTRGPRLLHHHHCGCMVAGDQNFLHLLHPTVHPFLHKQRGIELNSSKLTQSQRTPNIFATTKHIPSENSSSPVPTSKCSDKVLVSRRRAKYDTLITVAMYKMYITTKITDSQRWIAPNTDQGHDVFPVVKKSVTPHQ